jgi:sulfur-oxidizing protein SoxB
MDVVGYRYKLIPLFSDAIAPDPDMALKIAEVRAPFASELARVVGHSESLLYRRGTFNGTVDDLICAAILAERDAEIALSPGFRWGTTLLPGKPITVEDIQNATAMTYPQVYRTSISGERLKAILEDIADNLFNPDPYYQQGGDMVRCGGLAYRIDVTQSIGQRVSDLTQYPSGRPIESNKDYIVAGWASVTENVEGPPVWDLVERYVTRVQNVRIEPNTSVKVVGI